MGKIHHFLARLGLHSHSSESKPASNPNAKRSTSSLEAKRKAAREYMKALRARRKKEGISSAELARQREYNRKFMRKWRAKKKGR